MLRRLEAQIRRVLPRMWPYLARDKKDVVPVFSLLSSEPLFPQYRNPYSYLFFFTPNDIELYMGRSKAKTQAFSGRAHDGRAAGDPVGSQERTRGYQMEMFQESLKRNIIVAVREISQINYYLSM